MSSKNNNSSDDLKMSDSSASKENEWVDFSSSEEESDSSDDESVAEKKAAPKAVKPVAKNGGGKNNKENKTKQVPRKAGKSIAKAVTGAARRRAAAGKAAAGKAKDEFGREGAHHRLQGRVRPKSPAGRQMILSRRLSRRILKGTPLKSPITALKLDFDRSTKKAKGKKKRAKGTTNTSGRPPRARTD